MRGYIVLVKPQLALVISGSFLRKRKGCDRDMAPREGMYF